MSMNLHQHFVILAFRLSYNHELDEDPRKRSMSLIARVCLHVVIAGELIPQIFDEPNNIFDDTHN
jgi:hypothetical protein